MSFSGWDIGIFFDWIRRGAATEGSHRILIQAGSQRASRSHIIQIDGPTITEVAAKSIRLHHTWSSCNDGSAIENLHLSCLFTALVDPIINTMSAHAYHAMKTLCIQVRFVGGWSPATSTWRNLAVACPFITKLCLPYGHDNLLGLLKTDFGVWRELKTLTFFMGPEELPPLCSMVISRSAAGIPLHVIELHDREFTWNSQAVSVIKNVLDGIKFVHMI